MTTTTRDSDSRSIVLFDGVCNFCDHSVHFIVDRDPHAQFAFAALQSPTGQQLLARAGLKDGASIVLIEGQRVYTESTAVLRIASRLVGAWPVLYALLIVPKPVRDWAYRKFAAQRYRFGQLDACRVPTPELRARMLDLSEAPN